MKKHWIKGLSAIAGLLIIVGIVLNWVGILCFDPDFYKEEYTKLKTAESIGMSQEDLDQVTKVLLDYTKGARADLNVKATVNGVLREVFNEREIQHMADVKNLYIGAITFGNGALAAGLLFFLWAILFKRRKQAALLGYIHANWIFLLIFGMIGLYAAMDFNTFWVNFHHVFFTNDLWLLDPRTDILIMMVPGQFFFDLVMRILAACVATLGALLLGAVFWKKKLRKDMTDEL